MLKLFSFTVRHKGGATIRSLLCNIVLKPIARRRHCFNTAVWWRRLAVGLRTIYGRDRMVASPLWLVVKHTTADTNFEYIMDFCDNDSENTDCSKIGCGEIQTMDTLWIIVCYRQHWTFSYKIARFMYQKTATTVICKTIYMKKSANNQKRWVDSLNVYPKYWPNHIRLHCGYVVYSLC